MKLKEVFNHCKDSRVIFFADLHYNHANSIRHDSRNFIDVNEMNEFIKDTLGSSLKSGDVVFDLGDTFWKCDSKEIDEVLNCIPEGVRLFRVMGNHDKSMGNATSHYEDIYDSLDIRVNFEGNTYHLSLDHFPKVSWNHKPRGSFMIHGHTHGNIDDFNDQSFDLRVDVGFGSNFARKLNTFLIPFDEIYKHFRSKIGNCKSFNEWVLTNCKEL